MHKRKVRMILPAVIAASLIVTPAWAGEEVLLPEDTAAPVHRNYGYHPAKEGIVHHPVSAEDFVVGGETPTESRYVSEYYTQVNNQGMTGCCWAFASTSAVEGAIKKKYGDSVQMSWKNLAYYSLHKNDVTSEGEGKDYRDTLFKQSTFDQGPGSSGGDYGGYYASKTGPGGGGRSSGSYTDCVGNDTAYLFSGGSSYTAPLLYWQGRCLVKDSGDNALDVDLNNVTSYFDKAGKIGGSAGDDYRIKDAILVSAARSNMSNIKALIKEYGAGAVSYYSGDNDTESVYISESEAQQILQEYGDTENKDISNHMITIVGWDDNYSASNFGKSGGSGGSGGGRWGKNGWGDDGYDDSGYGYGGSGYGSSGTPEGDGAWICINSWGTGSDSGTDNGKTYISYYDGSLQNSEVAFFDVYKKGSADGAFLWSDNSYGTEGYDYPSGASTDALARGIIYSADKDVTLTAVSIFAGEDNAEYTLSIYGNPKADGGSISMTGNSPVLTQELSFPMAGVHNVALTKGIGIGKGQSVAVVFKPKRSMKNMCATAEEYTEEEAYWDEELGLYLGHFHDVSDASGMSLYESSDGKLIRMQDGDAYVRVYSNNGVSENSVTFEGSDFKVSDLNSGSGGSGGSDSGGGSGGYDLSGSYSATFGPDTYDVSWTTSVPYTGYPHIMQGTVKNRATPDVKIVVKKNGESLHPADYKIKFKNNKFVSGTKGKYPEFYVMLGRNADKTAKANLKKTPMRFDIRKTDISRDLDMSKFDVGLNKYWDRVTKLYDIYDKTTGSPTKFKLSKDGVRGDIVATVQDNRSYITITLRGINNCTGEVSESFEVQDDYGYGGGYDDDYGYGGGGYPWY